MTGNSERECGREAEKILKFYPVQKTRINYNGELAAKFRIQEKVQRLEK